MSTIYGDWARRYWEAGFVPVPIEPKTKRPNIAGLSEHFYNEGLSESDLDIVEQKRGHWNLGVALGKFSKIVAFDFDYVGERESIVEQALISMLPPSPVRKKGKKGWTAFYAYDSKGYDKCRISLEDENKATVFDALLSNCVTVLPPSNHSGKLDYHWLTSDTLLDINPSELPLLTNQMIMSIKSELSLIVNSAAVGPNVAKGDVQPNRYPDLRRFILRMSDKVENLDDLVTRAMEFDIRAHSHLDAGAVQNDEKYLGRGRDKIEPREFVKSLASGLCDWKTTKKKEQGLVWELGSPYNSFWIVDEKGKKHFNPGYQAFKEWFYVIHPEIKKCLVSNALKIKMPHQSGWKNAVNHVPGMRSIAMEYGIMEKHLTSHMGRMEDELKPTSIVDLPMWDGKDHIWDLCTYLESDYFTKDELCEIFKEFGSNMFIKMTKPNFQNRCLIIKGAQGEGKDTLVQNMFKDFAPYYGQVNPGQKDQDFILDCLKKVIVHIEEFDQTNSKSVAVLKACITQPEQSLRKAYGADHVDYAARFSWICTANPDDLFRDSTGNRRYIVMPISNIDFKYPKGMGPQIMAQMKHLADNAPFKVSPKTEAKIAKLIDLMTPEGNEGYVIDMWHDKTAYLTRGPLVPDSVRVFPNGDKGISGDVCARIIHEIALNLNLSVQKVRSVLKTEGFFRKSGERFYLLKNRQTTSDGNERVLEFSGGIQGVRCPNSRPH